MQKLNAINDEDLENVAGGRGYEPNADCKYKVYEYSLHCINKNCKFGKTIRIHLGSLKFEEADRHPDVIQLKQIYEVCPFCHKKLTGECSISLSLITRNN